MALDRRRHAYRAEEIQVGGPERLRRMDRGEARSFFISYAHADAGYVTRLAAHLASHDLPVWSDGDLRWGSRFPHEIQRRIAAALGIIVVMSPAAQASEWVEREILEGQRHDRVFLPILHSGTRLFLLASTHFVDARNGAMPGAAEIRQLRKIYAESVSGVASRPASGPPASVLPRPPVGGPPLVGGPPPVGGPPLVGGPPPVGGAAGKLLSFLDEGEFTHADILTTSLLLEAAGRLDNGWIRRADAARLPFTLLDEIDAAWASHGHGFRVQLDRYPGDPPGVFGGGVRDFLALARALGWRQSGRDPLPRYGEFVQRTGNPDGFFPTLRNPQREQYQGWSDSWRQTVIAVQLMLRKWGAGHV